MATRHAHEHHPLCVHETKATATHFADAKPAAGAPSAGPDTGGAAAKGAAAGLQLRAFLCDACIPKSGDEQISEVKNMIVDGSF